MRRLVLLAAVIALLSIVALWTQTTPASATDGSTAAATAGAPTTMRFSLANAKNPFEILAPDSPEMILLNRLAKDGFVTDHASELAARTPITRYEATVIAAEAITNGETAIHDGKAVAAVSLQDLAAAFDSFKSDLTALKGRVDTLDTRVTAVEQNQAQMHNDMVKLNQTVAAVVPTTAKPGFELHGEFRVRAVNAFSQKAAGVNPLNTPLPAGFVFTRTGGVGDGGVGIPIGDNGFGQQQARIRLVGTGNIGDNAKYVIRLSSEEIGGASNGLGSWIHNDFDFFEYKVPNTNWYFYGGKLLYCCNTPWLDDGSGMLADAVPIGGALKWTNGRWGGWLSAGSLKNAETSPTFIPGSPNVGFTQNITAGHIGGNLGPNTYFGYQFVALNSQEVTNFIGGVPVVALGPESAGSIFFGHHFTPMVYAQVEGLLRYGNDPTTKKGWDDNGAVLFDLNVGGTAQYQSSGRFRYVSSGKNSIIGALDSIVNGVDSMWNDSVSSPPALPYATNIHLYELGYTYQFDKNGHLDIMYGSSSLGKTEVGIDGSKLTKDDRNLFVVQTGFNF